jgi:hypothetical protein
MLDELKRAKGLLESNLIRDINPNGEMNKFPDFGLYECFIDEYQPPCLCISFRLCKAFDLYKVKALIEYYMQRASGFLSVEYTLLEDDKPRRRGLPRTMFKTAGDIHAIIN